MTYSQRAKQIFEAEIEELHKLAATIDSSFDKIISHANDIEARLDDSYCVQNFVKEDNENVIKMFTAAGEKVTVISENYESAVERVIDEIINA